MGGGGRGGVLAWRPFHLAATQEMEMQMVNRLRSMLAVVDHHTITVVHAEVLSHLIASEQQVSKQS